MAKAEEEMRGLILKLKRVKLNFSLEIGNDDDFVGQWNCPLHPLGNMLKEAHLIFRGCLLSFYPVMFSFFVGIGPEKIRLALQKEIKYTIPLSAIKLENDARMLTEPGNSSPDPPFVAVSSI